MQTESETLAAQDARPLATQPLGRLMRRYAVPCMTSLVVAALYNMVDQVFIANAPDLGSVGNAATTVVFPLTVAALAIAVMLGDGCCAFVSLMLGAGKQEEAHRAVGGTVTVSVLAGLVLMAAYLLFPDTLLTWFGGRVNAGTFEKAQEYFFWIALGVPLYVFGQAMNPVIRSDGSPTFAMIATLAGAAANLVLDPAADFRLPLWHGGRGDCNGCRAGADRWTVHLVSDADEADSPAKGQLPPARAFTGEMRQTRHDILPGANQPGCGNGGNEHDAAHLQRAGRCFLAGGIFRDSDGGFRHCHESVPNRHQLCDWAGGGMHSRGRVQHGRRTA